MVFATRVDSPVFLPCWASQDEKKKLQKTDHDMADTFLDSNNSPALQHGTARDPRIHDLIEYWTSKLRGRAMPSRSDIDPAEIVRLLPFIALVDVIPDTPIEKRYRVRLVGTQLVEFHQKDWTGKQIFDVTSSEAAQRIVQAGEFCVNHHRPWLSSGKLYWANHKSAKQFEIVIAPLSADGAIVNMLLALLVIVP